MLYTLKGIGVTWDPTLHVAAQKPLAPLQRANRTLASAIPKYIWKWTNSFVPGKPAQSIANLIIRVDFPVLSGRSQHPAGSSIEKAIVGGCMYSSWIRVSALLSPTYVLWKLAKHVKPTNTLDVMSSPASTFCRRNRCFLDPLIRNLCISQSHTSDEQRNLTIHHGPQERRYRCHTQWSAAAPWGCVHLDFQTPSGLTLPTKSPFWKLLWALLKCSWPSRLYLVLASVCGKLKYGSSLPGFTRSRNSIWWAWRGAVLKASRL